MFGLGFWEIVVIAVVALLFVGPDQLPQMTRKISKGIRDFRRQTRELQRTLSEDQELSTAVRELKTALRGDDLPPARPDRPHRPIRGSQPPTPPEIPAEAKPRLEAGADGAPGAAGGAPAPTPGEVPAEDADSTPVIAPAPDAIARGGGAEDAPTDTSTDRNTKASG